MFSAGLAQRPGVGDVCPCFFFEEPRVLALASFGFADSASADALLSQWCAAFSVHDTHETMTIV